VQHIAASKITLHRRYLRIYNDIFGLERGTELPRVCVHWRSNLQDTSAGKMVFFVFENPIYRAKV